MKFIFLFSLILMLGSLLGAGAQCICTADYTPVCGVNGQTYSNSCHLGCNGVRLAHKGPCS